MQKLIFSKNDVKDVVFLSESGNAPGPIYILQCKSGGFFVLYRNGGQIATWDYSSCTFFGGRQVGITDHMRTSSPFSR